MIPWFRGRAPPGLVLGRESARQARRPGMYLLRFALAIVCMLCVGGAILIGMYNGVDVARFSMVGRGAFISTTICIHLVTALVVPLLVALGTVEERDEGTLDLVALTRLRPLQIVLGKATSRLALFLSLVLGVVPIVALIMQYGGVGLMELGQAGAATAVLSVEAAILAGFIALESRSVVLPWLAVVVWELCAWVIAPLIAWTAFASAGKCPPWPAGCTDVDKVLAFSPLYAWGGQGPGDLVVATALHAPIMAVLLLFAVPTFRASVARQERRGFDVWAIRVFRALPAVVLAVGGVIVGGYAWPYLLSASPPLNPAVDAIASGTLVAVYGGTLLLCRFMMGIGTDGGPWSFPLAGRLGRRTTRKRWTGPWWLPVVWREVFTRAYGAAGWVPWLAVGLVAATYAFALLITHNDLSPTEYAVPIVVGIAHPFLLLVGWLVGTESGTQERPEILEPMVTTTFGMPRLVAEKTMAASLRALIPTMFTLLGGALLLALDTDRCTFDGPLSPASFAWLAFDTGVLVSRFATGVLAAVAAGMFIGLVVRPVRLAWAMSAGCLVLPIIALFALNTVFGFVFALLYATSWTPPTWLTDAAVVGSITFFAPSAELGRCGPHELVWYQPIWCFLSVGLAAAIGGASSLWMRRYGSRFGPGSAR